MKAFQAVFILIYITSDKLTLSLPKTVFSEIKSVRQLLNEYHECFEGSLNQICVDHKFKATIIWKYFQKESTAPKFHTKKIMSRFQKKQYLPNDMFLGISKRSNKPINIRVYTLFTYNFVANRKHSSGKLNTVNRKQLYLKNTTLILWARYAVSIQY